MRPGTIGLALVGLAAAAAVTAIAAALVTGKSPDEHGARDRHSGDEVRRETQSTALASRRDDRGDKLAALHAIMQATVDAVEAPLEYWQADHKARREHAEALIAARSRARAALIGQFGAGAPNEPVFRPLFRPLDRRFAILTSAQQIAIQDAELRLSVAGPEKAGAASHRSAFDEHLLRIRKQIGDAAAFEYAVRASPLSQQIRVSGVHLTEAEFRETYTLLSALSHDGADRNGPSQSDYRDIRHTLRNLLGTRRFTALWAARDPRFEDVVRIGERYGLDPDTVMSAYLVLNDAQDALLAAALDGGSDPRADATRLRAIYDASRTRLAEVVGEAAASAITAALSMPRDESPIRPPM